MATAAARHRLMTRVDPRLFLLLLGALATPVAAARPIEAADAAEQATPNTTRLRPEEAAGLVALLGGVSMDRERLAMIDELANDGRPIDAREAWMFANTLTFETNQVRALQTLAPQVVDPLGLVVEAEALQFRRNRDLVVAAVEALTEPAPVDAPAEAAPAVPEAPPPPATEAGPPQPNQPS